MKIVTVGGGSGQHGILTGLVSYSIKFPDKIKQENISAVVTTFDTGGHTGQLMKARIPKDAKGNFLPPGDIRQCLAAMANNEYAKKIFQHKIKDGSNKGTVVGNDLLDAAYEQNENDFEKGLELIKNMLDVRGNVFPCTLKRADFKGVLENGYEISGEEELVAQSVWYDSPIKKVFLIPDDIPGNHNAVKAILEADKIILSQGSLYTSLIPNLLVKDISSAIRNSKAKKIYVMNIVTQRGETDGLTAREHLEVIERYLGKDVIDYLIIHKGEIPSEIEKKYTMEGQERVIDDFDGEKKIIRAELIRHDSPIIRHDPEKLAEVIIRL